MWSNITWKSGNLNFGQLSLNLTHCAAPQTDIEPRYPFPDCTLEPFSLSSAAWYTTVIPENCPRNATNTLISQQPGTQLIHSLWPKSDRGTQLINPAFRTPTLEGGEWLSPCCRRFTPFTHCTGGWLALGASLHGMENFASTRNRKPDPPVRNKTPYQLRHPGRRNACLILCRI
jgi:hypothetical protein